MRKFNVYLNGKWADAVFYSDTANVTREEVRDSLVNHDGYDSRIVVREEHTPQGARKKEKRA